jgi:hypothetical protein
MLVAANRLKKESRAPGMGWDTGVERGQEPLAIKKWHITADTQDLVLFITTEEIN